MNWLLGKARLSGESARTPGEEAQPRPHPRGRRHRQNRCNSQRPSRRRHRSPETAAERERRYREIFGMDEQKARRRWRR
jgi:hypothetical protein